MTPNERRFMDAAVSVCKTFYGGPVASERQHRLHAMLIIYESIRNRYEPEPFRRPLAKARVVDGNIVIDDRLEGVERTYHPARKAR